MYIHDKRHDLRLNESIKLKYKILTDEEIQEGLDKLRTKFQLNLQGEAILNLESQLKNEINKQIKKEINEVSQTSPAISNALELINQRIDLLQTFLLELYQIDVNRSTEAIQLTSLSKSGIGFDIVSSVAVERLIFLEITLFPSKIKIMPIGKVVACEKNQDDINYHLQLQFVDIPKEQLVLLEKHIEGKLSELMNTKRKSK